MIKRHPKLAQALGSANENIEGSGKIPDYTAKLQMDQKFYFQYFVQDDGEDGTLMDTKIPIVDVRYILKDFISVF